MIDDRSVWSDKALYDALRDSEKWRSYPGEYDSDDDDVPQSWATSGSTGSTGEKQTRSKLRKKLSELVVRQMSDNQTLDERLYFRVDSLTKNIYKKLLTAKQKKMLREIIVSLIEKFASVNTGIAEEGVESVTQQPQNVIVNVNLALSKAEVSVEDEFTKERVRQLKEKLREANEVLKEYKAKVVKYDKIAHYVLLYRQGTIDVKELVRQVLNEVK